MLQQIVQSFIRQDSLRERKITIKIC